MSTMNIYAMYIITEQSDICLRNRPSLISNVRPSDLISPGCRFQVNFSAFHSTFEVTTPTISAKQLEKIMGGYVPPETRQMAELTSHLSNGTCLSPCHSLPSTLNRRKSALSAGKLLNGEDDDSDSIQVW